MQKNQIIKTAVVAATALGALQAHAALPPEATAAFTALQSDFNSMMTLVWGVLGVTTAAWVIVKVFKKGANKAV